jgi:hypothetical protein
MKEVGYSGASNGIAHSMARPAGGDRDALALFHHQLCHEHNGVSRIGVMGWNGGSAPFEEPDAFVPDRSDVAGRHQAKFGIPIFDCCQFKQFSFTPSAVRVGENASGSSDDARNS